MKAPWELNWTDESAAPPAAPSIDAALAAEGVTGRLAEIAKSIYQQESGGGRNTKTSNAGAVGGMQILPGTFRDVADKGWDINNPEHNLRAGIRYVKQMHDLAGGDPVLTGAGYYGGPGGLAKARSGVAVSDPRNPNAPTTVQYGQQVASRMKRSPIAQGVESMVNAIVPAAQAAERPLVNPWEINWADEQPPAAVAPVAEPAPASRTAGESIAHGLGVGARGLVRGLVEMPGMVTDAVTGPINAGLDAVAGGGNGFRFQRAGAAADNLMTAAGMAQAQTRGERIAEEVSRGAAGGAGFAGAGRFVAALASGPLSRALGSALGAGAGMQTASGAAGAGAGAYVKEEGGGVGAQFSAALAAGMAPTAVPYALRAGLRGALRGGEEGRQAVATTVDTFQKAAGTMPTIGQATQSQSRQALETGLSNTLGGSRVMARRAEEQAAAMQSSVEELAAAMSPRATSQDAGAAITRGVNAFKEGTKATQAELYEKLDQFIPGQSTLRADRTKVALRELNADIAGAPALSKWFKNARIQGIEGALDADTGGTAAVLSRPGMKERADALRSQLTEESQRAAAANERHIGALKLQADEATEANRLWRIEQHQKEEQARQANADWRAGLQAEADAATQRNLERRQLGMANLEPVQTPKEIKALPDRFPVMSRQDIDALPAPNHVMSADELRSVRPPNVATSADDIEREVQDFLLAQVDNSLPYESLKKLRTLVGREISDAGLVADVPRSKWRALYRALSEDLGDAAKAAGPQAEQAWSRANTYTRASIERLEHLEGIVNKDAPEMIFRAALSNSSEGGTKIARLMKSLPDDSRREVTAAALLRLGRAKPGNQNEIGDVFSSETFLTNLAAMSDQAKRALFVNSGFPGLHAKVQELGKMASVRREGGKVFSNASGTARQAALLTWAASLGAAIGTGNWTVAGGLLGGTVLGSAAARVVTSPAMVRVAASRAEASPALLPSALQISTSALPGGAAAAPAAPEVFPWDIDWEPGAAVQPEPAAAVVPPDTPRVEIRGVGQLPDGRAAPELAGQEPALPSEAEAPPPTQTSRVRVPRQIYDAIQHAQAAQGLPNLDYLEPEEGEPMPAAAQASAPAETAQITQPIEPVAVAAPAPVAAVEAPRAGQSFSAALTAAEEPVPSPAPAASAAAPAAEPEIIHNRLGKPFTVKIAADRAAREAGEGARVEKVDGGYVVVMDVTSVSA